MQHCVCKLITNVMFYVVLSTYKNDSFGEKLQLDTSLIGYFKIKICD